MGFPDCRNGKKYNKLKEISRNSEVLKGIEYKYRTGMSVPLHAGQKVVNAIYLINEISSSANISGDYILTTLRDENIELDLLSK